MMERIKENDWVPVTESMFLKDAEVIGAVLEQEGIQTKIVEPNTVIDPTMARVSIFGQPLKTGQVVVPKQLLQKARAVLEAQEKQAEAQE